MTSSHPVQIRPATVADAKGIAAVHIDAWQAAYRGIVPDIYLSRMDAGQRSSRWRERLSVAAPMTTVVVAAAGEEILGFGSCGPYRVTLDKDDAAGVGEVYALYVAPRAWRQGLGSRLLAGVEAALRANGTDTRLWVLSANPGARQFYEARGWRLDGSSVDLDLDAPVPAVRYAKTLATG
ncbi:MAG: GNAT family N-acetyltransferase [Candidatus Dormibacteria bacterium]